MASLNRCNISEYSQHLSGLRIEKMIEHLRKYFFSPNVMQAAKCICSALTATTILSSKDRFREYIKASISNLDSAEYSASINIISDGVFIIKSCSDEQQKDLFKEGRLGLEFLNDLRMITPCFRYVFSYLDCSPIVNDNSSIAICLTDGPGYCIVEKIDGLSMEEFLGFCTFEEFMKVYIMMLLSLNCTMIIKLMLNNCKCNNIQLRVLETEMMVNFNVEGKIYSISSKYIPVVMDTTMSNYILDDSIDEEVDYIELYDAYCLFTDSYRIINDYRRDFTSSLTPLFNWFSIKTTKGIIAKISKIYLLCKNNNNRCIKTLIDFCYSNSGILSDGEFLKYNKKFSTELIDLGMTDYGDDLSFIEYYDLKNKKPEQAISHFKFLKSFEREIDIIARMKEHLIIKIEIEKISVTRMGTSNYIVNFKRRSSAFIVYLSTFHRVKLHSKIGREIVKDYNKKFTNFYDDLDIIIEEHRIWLLKMKNRMIEIQECVNNLDDINLTECLEWYKQGVNLLVLALQNEDI